MIEVYRHHHKLHFNSYFMPKMNITCFKYCLYLVFLFQVPYIITASYHGQIKKNIRSIQISVRLYCGSI